MVTVINLSKPHAVRLCVEKTCSCGIEVPSLQCITDPEEIKLNQKLFDGKMGDREITDEDRNKFASLYGGNASINIMTLGNNIRPDSSAEALKQKSLKHLQKCRFPYFECGVCFTRFHNHCVIKAYETQNPGSSVNCKNDGDFDQAVASNKLSLVKRMRRVKGNPESFYSWLPTNPNASSGGAASRTAAVGGTHCRWMCPVCRMRHLDPFYPTMTKFLGQAYYFSPSKQLPMPYNQNNSTSIGYDMEIQLDAGPLHQWMKQGCEVHIRCVRVDEHDFRGPHWPVSLRTFNNAKELFEVKTNKRFINAPQAGHHRKEVAFINLTPYLTASLNKVKLVPEFYIGKKELEDGTPPGRFLIGCLLVQKTSIRDLTSRTDEMISKNLQKHRELTKKQLEAKTEELEKLKKQLDEALLNEPLFAKRKDDLLAELTDEKADLERQIASKKQEIRDEELNIKKEKNWTRVHEILHKNFRSLENQKPTSKKTVRGRSKSPDTTTNSKDSNSENDDDSDVEMVFENSSVELRSVSLRCPISAGIIAKPVISKNCVGHIQAFDMEGFFEITENMRNLRQRWRCPTCHNRMMPFDLRHCEFTQRILEDAKGRVGKLNEELQKQRAADELQNGSSFGGHVKKEQQSHSQQKTNNNVTSDSDDDDADDNQLRLHTLDEFETVLISKTASWSFTYNEEKNKERASVAGAVVELLEENTQESSTGGEKLPSGIRPVGEGKNLDLAHAVSTASSRSSNIGVSNMMNSTSSSNGILNPINSGTNNSSIINDEPPAKRQRAENLSNNSNSTNPSSKTSNNYSTSNNSTSNSIGAKRNSVDTKSSSNNINSNPIRPLLGPKPGEIEVIDLLSDSDED